MERRPLIAADFRALPKAELHLHTEAAMRPDTAREFAERYGLPLPPLSDAYPTWPEFNRAYESCRALVGSLDDLRRVVGEVFDAAPDAGVVWTELHLGPHLYQGRLGPPEALVEAALDGLAAARGDGGMILGIGRDRSPVDAAEVAALAVRHRDRGIVAMGLTGNEAGHPADDFAEAFRIAREGGLAVVPHAGESGPASSVRNTVDLLTPDRVCHGVRAVEDPGLVRELAERRICLDLALTGNVMLKAVESAAAHPLPALVRAGVPVTLNSDAPYLYGIGILDEYATAHSRYGLSATDLARIAADSLRFSAAGPDLAARMRDRIDAWAAHHGRP
ncbi:adenosine deaminase [Streptomyces violaceusniger]|uniref:Putative adenosine/adenine deaminase n=1 Tax=Streptomyces violaceusniger TaxID=68280 RepID=A0A4D4KXX7_STRVO|nr:putative adenosine/adenine deaminase [Streptomyces violaceusniger]